jgi:hypothetical protein
VHQGYAMHGLTPVVLVLGQLQSESRSSFFYAPSLDLLRMRKEDGRLINEVLGDLDIVCLSDGKLIIGEVKQSRSQFDGLQIRKLAEIARTVSADMLVLSSMDEHPGKRVSDLIEMAQNMLTGARVQVKWFDLDRSVFEPDLIW